MSIRFLHTADVHFDANNQVAALASMDTLAQAAEREKPAFVALSGDLFNRGVQNSAAAGFPALLAVIQRILNVCPIVAVSGTPTHDLTGSYEALAKIEGKHSHNFVMIQPGNVYYRDSFNDCICGDFVEGQTDVLILGCPEPTREWLVAQSDSLPADQLQEVLAGHLRRVFLGLGAVRARHPGVPCVMLYHGAVSGATMQNGQLVEGGISIGRDDLALVGADYYALGHIHLAQQIPGIPAYYTGSAYPCNWGEVEQKGFNLVEIDGSIVDVRAVSDRSTITRLPFPHPPRAKFSVEWPEPVGDEMVGKQAWINYRVRKEDMPINTEALLEAYLADGALPGSRVTVEVLPTETVRAAEITESHGLEEKLVIYADASSQDEPSESIRTKANELEREAEASGASPEGLHVRIKRLRLRGAIGIWKGQHVDEIDVDLTQHDEGLIALVGENGAGKTTLIENMHPYPCMLTRDGSLQQHFRLRDSLRELTFVDERTGSEYRALIQIDGANASGSCEYHLFRNGEPLTNGRKADYEAAILRLFGSLPLFLRSAFVSQRSMKSNPDLTEATKGEKKAIFRELAGLDYLQSYADSAKAKGNAIETDITTERARVNLIESQLTALPGIRSDVEGKRSDLLASVGNLKGLEACGKALSNEVEALEKKVSDQRSLAQRIAALDDQAAQKRQVIELAEESIRGYQASVDERPLAEHLIGEWTQFKAREAEENEQIGKVSAERARISAEYANAVKAHGAVVQGVEAAKGKHQTEVARLEGDRRVAQAQLKHLTDELAHPLNDTCPKCHQVLPATTLGLLRAEREKSEVAKAELEGKIADIDGRAAEEQKTLAAIVAPGAPPSPRLPVADATALVRIRASLAQLDIDQARQTLTTAQEATARIEESRKQIAQASIEAKRLETESASAGLDLDPSIAAAYQQAKDKLEGLRRQYGEAQKAVAALEAQIASMEGRIAELERQQADIEERKAKMAAAAEDLAEWRYLERACGPDGIQALELDAMGPSIAEVANRLLSAAYGSRFSIEFRTTRMAGKGSKTKQVEDFAIWILDSSDGSEQELSTLSGGESVWVKRSIYDAFGIIRERSTGTRFLTVFADEADGALDPEAKARYVEMMRQAHAESKRAHTIVITHSSEAQEMIGQKIVMSDLAKQEVVA